MLLVDEIDRTDDEFEAFLLEVLSDFSVTIPELGAIRAARPPAVIISSNRTRGVHDALKRRCLYHWIDHPDFAREVAIVRTRLPAASERLARQVTVVVQRCATRTSPSRRGSRRRSTGPRRSSHSAPSGSMRTWPRRRSGRS